MRHSLMTTAGLAALLAMGRVELADAQNALVIANCGSATPKGSSNFYMDTTGDLCTSAVLSGTISSTVTVGASALPTGAATAANQEVTAAGTSAASAQAVQGVTGGIPVPVSGTFTTSGTVVISGTVPVSGTVAITGTVPVSGTVTSTPSGTTTVAGTIAVSGTVPVSAASLPLPTGAATAANQEVTQAGTSAASAQGVQGVTGGIAMPVSGTVAVSGTSAISGTVAVSGTIPVSGTVTSTPSGTTTVAGTIAVSSITGTIPVVTSLNFGFIPATSSRLKNTVTISGTTTETLMAATSSLHNYLTDLMCFRTDTGTTIAYVTLNDDNSTPIPLPQGSGAATPISVPIVSNGTNTAITFTSQAGITGTCTTRGYSGTWLLDDLPIDALPKEEGREHLALFDNLNSGLANV